MANSVAQGMGSPRYAKPLIRASTESIPGTDKVMLTSSGGSSIILPFPTNIGSTTTTSWEQADAGMSASVLNQKSLSDSMKEAYSQFEASFGHKAKSMIAQGILGDGAAKAMANRTGEIVNPAKENYFLGSDFRSFNLTFNLIPVNAGDTATYKEAILALQKGSLPSVPQGQTGRMMKYPDSWNIIFMPGEYLPKYKEAVLTNLTVDYSAAGKTYLHVGGGPVQMNLQLSFTELTVLIKEEVGNEAYG
jgi:hypothetical protein